MGLETIAATLESQVLARAIPLAPRAVILPEEDDAPEGVAEHLGDAEGQSFMIEYIDAAGRASSRRITVYHISLGHAEVLDADGRRHGNELEFLDNLCLELTGVGLR